MKKVIFAFFIFIFCCCSLFSQHKSSNKLMNPTLESIFSRKSVRNFVENKPVEREKLEMLVRAAMAAPTAVNAQPWTFIIVTRRELLDSLAETLPYAKMLFFASAAIIVCTDSSLMLPELGAQFWIQDCSAATENLLLAAESMGLGAVWTAAYPIPERIESIHKVLELPSNIIPLNVIPVGYPTGEDKPKDKWKPERIHWEKWK